MSSKGHKKLTTIEEDYEEIMKSTYSPQYSYADSLYSYQWENPGDFIVKFSLYQENPYGLASTNTLSILEK